MRDYYLPKSAMFRYNKRIQWGARLSRSAMGCRTPWSRLLSFSPLDSLLSDNNAIYKLQPANVAVGPHLHIRFPCLYARRIG